AIQGTPLAPSTPTNPGQRDPQAMDRRHRIMGTIAVHRATRVGHQWVNPLPHWMGTLRHHLITGTNRLFPHPYADLLIGLTIGDDGVTLPTDMTDRFTQSGLTHLLVVSGSQVSLLIGLQSGLLMRLPIAPFWRMIFMLISNSLFYILCGGGVSILRAILMSDIAMGVALCHRRLSTWHTLLLTISVMTLLDPGCLGDLGAHLSLAATASLLWGVPWLSARLGRFPEWSRTPLALVVAPFVFTAPFTIGALGTVSPASLLTNALALPIIECLVPVGLLTIVCGAVFLPLGPILAPACTVAMSLMNQIAMMGTLIPGGLLHLPSPPPWVTWGWVWLLAHWVIPEWQWIPYRRGLTLLILSASLTWALMGTVLPRPLRVICLDVGQGDATLLIMPTGYTLLIDTGNRLPGQSPHRGDYAGTVILPALRYYGVTRLDTLLITHEDMDHMAGVGTLLRHISIGQIMGRPSAPLQAMVGNRAIEPIPFDTDWVFEARGAVPTRLRWLHTPYASESNDRSICLQVLTPSIRFLFTGDGMENAERSLVMRYGSRLRSDVLHVGHHGSLTSSHPWFLQTVRAQWGVISVGQRNTYGHPHPTILRRLYQHGMHTLRTDREGAIEWTIRPKGIDLRQWGSPPSATPAF
ncbi:DNA internalization-related competence protein ComEC/Rec2, partial [bacterium]|nr:DNA internalization-related competence protein ComEC/Rec2 [bacterium]